MKEFIWFLFASKCVYYWILYLYLYTYDMAELKETHFLALRNISATNRKKIKYLTQKIFCALSCVGCCALPCCVCVCVCDKTETLAAVL